MKVEKGNIGVFNASKEEGRTRKVLGSEIKKGDNVVLDVCNETPSLNVCPDCFWKKQIGCEFAVERE